MKKSITILMLTAAACICSPAGAEPRILLDAQINDQPVMLALDTGSEATFIFRHAADRLGLKATPPPGDIKLQPGEVPYGVTEQCAIKVGGEVYTTRLRVVALAPYIKLDVDGVIGWPTIRNHVLEIRPEDRKLKLSNELSKEVSEKTSNWKSYDIDTEMTLLAFKIPHKDDKPGLVYIDTGSPGGIDLTEQRWRQWFAANPARPFTLGANYAPGYGVVVSKEAWAARFQLDRLTILQVPVTGNNTLAKSFPSKKCEATFGLYALNRLNIVIDGRKKKVYIRAVSNPVRHIDYEYNRLAAVFVPDSKKGIDLVAHVVEDGPACLAGIRNGDILLKIGELDTTKWKTDPNVLPLSRFWSRPAGTSLNLTIRRNQQTHDFTATLRDIFKTD